MGSEQCQSPAGKSGTFFPSIPASMDASAQALSGQGVDLSVFTGFMKNGNLAPAGAYGNGSALESALRPLFEGYFSHKRDDDVFAEMEKKSAQILTK